MDTAVGAVAGIAAVVVAGTAPVVAVAAEQAEHKLLDFHLAALYPNSPPECMYLRSRLTAVSPLFLVKVLIVASGALATT